MKQSNLYLYLCLYLCLYLRSGGSLHQAKQMLGDLILEARRFGLEVHEDKTKFLWNGVGRGTAASNLELCGKHFEVLNGEASTMYLGRKLSLRSLHETELKNRMAKGWAKFAIYRDELTNSYYSLRQRMRLFVSVVQPSVLYGCVSWTMTKEREQLLRTTQRKMMRKVVGTKRIVVKDAQGGSTTENYVDWVQRATRKAEEAMDKYGVPDWVGEACKRKFQWAGHVSRRDDGRWSGQILRWCPVGVRLQGRPVTRWSDALNKFYDSVSAALGEHIDWITLAADRDKWKQMEEAFVEFSTGGANFLIA